MRQIIADKTGHLLISFLFFSLSLHKSAIVNRYSLINLSRIIIAYYFCSIILGGYSNKILNADFSLAFGNDVSIDDDYVTVFYNSTYSGKVGINEESPDEALHVVGTAKIEDVLKLEPRSTAPTASGPEDEGLMYYDTEDHMLYVFDGTHWQACW